MSLTSELGEGQRKPLRRFKRRHGCVWFLQEQLSKYRIREQLVLPGTEDASLGKQCLNEGKTLVICV